MTTTPTTKTCDICPAPAVAFRRGIKGRLYACAEHRPYLAGWQRDERHEQRCESRAAAAFERAAYGGRDDY